ncbi:FecR family protein [Candidatus Binatia bacterium]|nr:FecR family protein [Candidatus Binatia bacterium]
MWSRFHRFALSVAFLLAPVTATAQTVGTIAALDGTAEVGREGAWTPAALGAEVHAGDALRTGPSGRVLLSLGDEALNIGEDSEVLLERLAPADVAESTSKVKLERGSLRTVVSDQRAARSRFEVVTPVAIAAVTGTEFVMTYDPVAEVSDVVGVAGTVQVHSNRWPTRRGVAVTAQEVSTIRRGAAPSRPTRIADASFRQYIEDLEIVPSTLPAMAAARMGTAGTVPQADRAGAFKGPPGVSQPQKPDVKTCWGGTCWVPADPPMQPPDAIQRGSLNVRF